MRKYLPITGIIFTLALAGCASPSGASVDIGAEKAAIEKMVAAHSDATNKPGEEGAEGYAAFVTEDAIWLPPNSERIEGPEAVRAFALAFSQSEGWSVGWQATSIEVSADGQMAYVIGTYELSLKDPAGNPVSDEGKLVNILKKQADGSWKVAVGIWNSDLPAGE